MIVSDKYWTNPQFFVTLRDRNRWDGINKCTLVVSLLQKYTRRMRTELGTSEIQENAVGFDILKVE